MLKPDGLVMIGGASSEYYIAYILLCHEKGLRSAVLLVQVLPYMCLTTPAEAGKAHVQMLVISCSSRSCAVWGSSEQTQMLSLMQDVRAAIAPNDSFFADPSSLCGRDKVLHALQQAGFSDISIR